MTALKITPEHVYAARRELSKRSLADFVRLAWPVIEPGQPYVHGPHIDVMCQALERVASGETRRLLLNVPPGTSKSTICGVFFPMWIWGPQDRPSSRFVGVAHEQTLGIRDNLKCRRLAASDWYQKLWGHRVILTKDQNAKINFENTATGFRQVATPSNITGRRGDFVILDDPLSAENANSEAEREKVNLWFRESLPTRLNNPDSSAIIVVMQRLHERDVSGLILAEKLGYEHVMLPMRFEPDRASEHDWRTEEGELLFPARFSEETVAELEKTLGPYATAGQLQQRPAPREGGLFKSSWFEIIDALPVGRPRTVRAWDLAATKKAATNNPDWTAGLKACRYPDGTFVILNVRRLRGSPMEVENTVIQTAKTDGTGVTIRMTQDPGQAGKAQAEQFVRKLAGYPVVTKPATGDKSTRATPAAAQAEVGNIKIFRTGDEAQDAWIAPFLDEIALFPAGAHDDQVDVLADAINELALARVHNLSAWG
jgi:predicted phage terminase large subunit-like protein